MSDRTLTATISAVDRASPVLRAVSSGAETMGKTVAAAGTTAAGGMAKAEAGGNRLKTVYQNLEGAGTALGRVTFAVGELFGEVAQFGADAQASEERLKVAVEDTGHAWEDDAAAMERAIATGHALAFSKEDVEGALAKLITVTKDSNTALTDLALSEDIARARGINLSEAALAVGRAEEGQSAALSRLGFVVDHTATATQQLAQVQQQVAGQSAAFAGTTAGSIDRMRDSFHNLLAGIGNDLGPFQTFLALMPGLSATGVLVSGAFGRLAEVFLRDEVAAEAAAVGEEHLAVATEAAGASAAEAEVASGGLLAVLGPIGLVAAAAAAAFGLYELVKGHTAEAAAAKAADAATKDLAATLGRLNAAGDANAQTFALWGAALQAVLAQVPAEFANAQKAYDDFVAKAGQGPYTPEQQAQYDGLARALQVLGTVGDDAGVVLADFAAVLHDTGTGAALAQKAIADLFAAFAASDHGVEAVAALASGIASIGGHLGDYDTQANAAAAATTALALAQGGAADTFTVLKAASDGLTASFKDTAVGQHVLADIQAINTKGTQGQRDAVQANTAALLAGKITLADYTTALDYMVSSNEHATTATDAHTQATIRSLDANSRQAQQQQTLADEMAAQAANSTDLATAQNQLNVTWAQSAQGIRTLTDLQTIATQGTDQQKAAVRGLYQDLLAQTKTEQQYSDAVHTTALSIALKADNDAKAKAATDANTQAEETRAKNLNDLNTIFDQNNLKTAEHTRLLYADTQAAVLAGVAFGNWGKLTIDQQEAIDHLKGKTVDITAAVKAYTDAQDKSSHKTVDITKEVKAYTDGLALEAKTADDAAVALGVLATVAERLHPIDLSVTGGDRAVGTAAALQQLGTGLDAVLGTFAVLDTMASKGKQAGSIAENLVGKPGEWAQIDSLLKNGEISLTRYNETIAAGYSLEKRQAEIEENLNIVRAKQLPLLNDQEKAYSDYIEKLSHLSPLEQEVALGFMDTTEAAKAQQAVTLAAAAAMGQLGDAGKATATQIIQGAAAADPVLAAMLEKIGLISVDHEGKVTVNFPNAKSLNDDIEGLSASIDALTVALGGVPPLTTAEVDMIGDPAGKAAEVQALKDALAGLDGMTATATLNNVTNNITNSINDRVTGGAFALGGVVPSDAAWGGLVTRAGRAVTLGEAGPETVILPSGSYVRNAAATAAEGRGGVTVNQYFTGDINGVGQLEDVMAAAARSLRAHFAGMGA